MSLRATMIGLAIVAPVALAAAQAGGWRASAEAVERAAKQQPGFNYDESRVEPYALTDPLADKGGRVTSVETWRARRAEIVDRFRAHVYGRSPGRPEHVAFSVIEENAAAIDGTATPRRIAIVSHAGARSHRFELTLFLPNKPSRAVPVFLLDQQSCRCVSIGTRHAERPLTSSALASRCRGIPARPMSRSRCGTLSTTDAISCRSMRSRRSLRRPSMRDISRRME